MKKLLTLLMVISCGFGLDRSPASTLKDPLSGEYLSSKNRFIKDVRQRKELEKSQKELRLLSKELLRTLDANRIQELTDRKRILESKLQFLASRHDKIYMDITKITAKSEPYNVLNFFSNKPMKNADAAIASLIKIQQEFQYADNFVKKYLNVLKPKLKKTLPASPERLRYARLLHDKRYLGGYKELIEKQYEHLLEQRSQIEKEYYEYRDGELFRHLLSLIVLIAIFVTVYLLRKLFSRYVEEDEQRFTLNRTINSVAVIVALAFIFFTYSENIIYSLTVFTFVGAAVIIASREFLINIIARIYISLSNFVKVGDRVLIPHESKYYYGDIINISFVKITLYEAYDFSSTREAVSAGRVIFIPNSYIFSHAVISYSHQAQKMIFDHLAFSFSLDSDLSKAEAITREVLKEQTEQYREAASQQFNNLKKRYAVKQRMLEPEIQFTVNAASTAVKMTAWYMSPSSQATSVKNRLLDTLLKRFNAEPEVNFLRKTAKSTSTGDGDEKED